MNHFWFICSWKNQWGRAKQTFGVKSFSTRRALTPYTATEKKMSPISITAAEKNSREVNDYLLTMKLFVTVCFFWSSAIITTAILAGSLKIFRSQVCWYSFSNFAAEITTRSHCILYTTFHKLLKAWHKKHTSQNSWENCFDIAFMDMRYSRTRHSSSVWYLPSRIYMMARNNISQQLIFLEYAEELHIIALR